MSEKLIDYLTMKIIGYETPESIIHSFLGLKRNDFVWCKAENYYKYGLKYNNIRIYYGGISPNMGICISMSGDGCREYCYLKKDPYALFRLFNRLEASDAVTRLDIAFDDHQGKLNLMVMRDKINNKEIRTRLEKQHEDSGLGGTAGHTLYIGSEQSDYSVRIYDKAAKEKKDCHWIRAEEKLKGRYAKQFMSQFLQAVNPEMPIEEQEEIFYKQATELFLAEVAFIENRKGNVSRSSVCTWWTDFLNTATPQKKTITSDSSTLASKEQWFRNCMSPLLAALTMILGPGWLLETLAVGIGASRRPHSKYAKLSMEYGMEGKCAAMEINENSERECMEAIYLAIEQYYPDGLLNERSEKSA